MMHKDDSVDVSKASGVLLESAGVVRSIRYAVCGFLCFGLLVSIMWGGTLVAWFRHSLERDLDSHIVLVPIVSTYLIYLKRFALGGAPVGSPLAASFVTGAGVILGLYLSWSGDHGGRDRDSIAQAMLAFWLLMFGGALWFFGWRWLKAVSFPIFFLLFMIPLPAAAVVWLEWLLVAASAEAAHGLFWLGGIPVFRDGYSLQIPGIVLEVARECSGIRSTWVLIITSILASYLLLEGKLRRGLLIAVVLPLGILRNGLRIFVIGFLCVHYGPEMIHSWVHRNGGPLFFGLSLVPLLALGWALRER
jgi:exosortase C (VPDSG-CTERM-specific)